MGWREECVELFREGRSVTQVASALDLPEDMVRRAVIESWARQDTDDVAEMVRLYVDEGMTTHEVARAMHADVHRVCDQLRLHGVLRGHGPERGAPMPRLEFDREECERLAREGVDYQTIADRLGISRLTVGRYCRSIGIHRGKG